MNRIKFIGMFFAVVLILITSACGQTSGALLEDDFSGSDSNWGIGTDADSSVEYVNDALNISVNKENYFVWSSPNSETYENVHAEATTYNSSSDSTGASSRH